MTKFPFFVAQVAALALITVSALPAGAYNYFVLPTTGAQLSANEKKTTSDLIRSYILKHSGDDLVAQPSEADYILQPKVLETHVWQMLTIEKIDPDLTDGEVVVVSQIRIHDRDMRLATKEALIAVLGAVPTNNAGNLINELPTDLAANLTSATTSAPPDEVGAPEGAVIDRDAKPLVGRNLEQPPISKTIYHYWTGGVGVFDLNNLHSQHAHLAFNGGHEWNINNHIGVSGRAEIILPTSNNDDAFLADVTASATYYLLPSLVGSPYATAGIGLGAARTDDHSTGGGLAYTAGIGYQFNRAFIKGRGLGYDVQVHYASVLHDLRDSFPSVIGLRLSLNF